LKACGKAVTKKTQLYESHFVKAVRVSMLIVEVFIDVEDLTQKDIL
jgi:hypothetical protein